MITDKDREELLKLFNKLQPEVVDCLDNHNVIPSSITHNEETVGITIEFRKIYPEDKGV